MILVSVECFLFICDFPGSWCGEWFLFVPWTWVLCYEILHFIWISFFRKLPLTLHRPGQGGAMDDGENCGFSPPLSCDTGEREEAPCYHWVWKSRVPTWSPLKITGCDWKSQIPTGSSLTPPQVLRRGRVLHYSLVRWKSRLPVLPLLVGRQCDCRWLRVELLLSKNFFVLLGWNSSWSFAKREWAFLVFVFIFLSLMFPGCQLLQHPVWDTEGKRKDRGLTAMLFLVS